MTKRQTVKYELRSTPPSREATLRDVLLGAFGDVAIHAPLAGGDIVRTRSTPERAVAIHAPLAGGDSPRVRRSGMAMLRSTPPSREATGS